jgi:hypothetical protein
MQTDRSAFEIDDRGVAEISVYCEIARANNSLLTLSELAELTSVDATDEEFENAWNSNSELSSRYRVESGYVVDESGPGSAHLTVGAEGGNRERARMNVAMAREFAKLCTGPRVRMLAVAGGNSYKSARRGDDIDIFCVTTKDSLWVFMLKALVLARLRGLSRHGPPLCFSYVIDEERARTEFGEEKDGLFARDALSATVMVGRGFYRELLAEGSWMRRYFPRMYELRSAALGRVQPQVGHRKGSYVLNSFLYCVVGSYVRMKAALLNRKYISRGESSSVFQSRVGKDHCIYESDRYKRLRKMYARSGGAAK